MYVIVILPDGTCEEKNLEYRDCQRVVGGDTELVRLCHGVWAYLHKSRDTLGLSLNPLAASLWGALDPLASRAVVRGAVVLVGVRGTKNLGEAATVKLRRLIDDLRTAGGWAAGPQLSPLPAPPPGCPPSEVEAEAASRYVFARSDDAWAATEQFVRRLLPATDSVGRGGRHTGTFGRVFWHSAYRTGEEPPAGDKDFIVWVNGETLDWRTASRGDLRRICAALRVPTSETSGLGGAPRV